MHIYSEIEGKRIRLINMSDNFTDLKNGDEGYIKGINSLGDIIVKWDNGSTLSIIPGLDEYEIIDENKKFIRRYESFIKENNELKRTSTDLEKNVMIFLNTLRESGVTNMFGAVPYIVEEFGIDKKEARRILQLWMKNFNKEGDYSSIIE
jgi:hypothetical protein